MTSFAFPQAGERVNSSAVPVPLHTLVALLAAALAWEIDTDATFPNIVPPQIRDATVEALGQLDETNAHNASSLARSMMQERTEAEQG
jgi:hypothetical protein